MSEFPLISIIVPVFNAADHLNKCVDSILNQSLQNIELILVNDGSTDKSGEICDYYLNLDSRVRVLHTENHGHGGARKFGLEIAKGKYIGWVDADDWVDEDMFETLYKNAELYQSDILECSYIQHDGELEIIKSPKSHIFIGENDQIFYEFLSSRMSPGFWNKLYKRELFENINFPVGRIHVDFYVNVLMALKPLKYVRIPVAKYHYINRSDNITNSFTEQKIREAIYLYDYTLKLANVETEGTRRKKLLLYDAVNRLLGRYFTISSNRSIKNQRIYSRIIRNKLKGKFLKYLIISKLPLKTKVNYILLIFSLMRVQKYIHNLLFKQR